MQMSSPTELFIDGSWRPAVSGKTFPAYNPGTGEIIGRVAEGNAEDIDRAVAAARRAFEGPWSNLAPSARGVLLRKIASAIRANSHQLALLDTRNAGRPIRDTRNDLIRAADIFD